MMEPQELVIHHGSLNYHFWRLEVQDSQAIRNRVGYNESRDFPISAY